VTDSLQEIRPKELVIEMVKNMENLKAEISAAVEKLERNKRKIAEAPDLPAKGDIYTFAATAGLGIEWAVVRQHIDDAALWFIIPLDQNPYAGTWDVAVSEFSEAGAGTLRCGRGIWIHADDIDKGSRSGFIEPDYVDEATQRLAAMVQGEVNSHIHRPDVDEDPEYQEWMEEVTAAAEKLEHQLLSEPEVFSLADFSTAWTEAPGIRSNQPTALAAASDGLGAGPEEEIEPLPAIVIAKDLPGVLTAVNEGDGLRIQYHPVAENESVAVSDISKSSARPVEWRRCPDGVIESTELIDFDADIKLCVDGTELIIKSDTDG
jgi:hypothetical protein